MIMNSLQPLKIPYTKAFENCAVPPLDASVISHAFMLGIQSRLAANKKFKTDAITCWIVYFMIATSATNILSSVAFYIKQQITDITLTGFHTSLLVDRTSPITLSENNK